MHWKAFFSQGTLLFVLFVMIGIIFKHQQQGMYVVANPHIGMYVLFPLKVIFHVHSHIMMKLITQGNNYFTKCSK